MSEAERDTRRIAVVFIHGQGEQRPMEDIQELARTVCENDPELKSLRDGQPLKTWTVPDPTVGLADTGRVTTDAGKHHSRIDFLEFYWAHLMTGNRADHVLKWIHALQKRPRKEAPDRLRMIRQGILRAAESFSFIALGFAVLVALSLPPPNEADDSQRLFAQISTGFRWSELNAAFVLSWAALVLMLASVAWILITDIRGGGGGPKRSRTLRQLKGDSRKQGRQALRRILLAPAVFMFVALAATSLGPTLETADLRFAILPMIVLSSALAIMRLVATAAMVSLITALLALAAAFGAPLDASNAHAVLFLGDSGSFDSNWLTGKDWLREAAQPVLGVLPVEWVYPRAGLLTHALFFVQFLAGCWFLGGLNESTGAQKLGSIRFVLVLIWIVLSIGASLLMFWTGFVERPAEALMFWLGGLLVLIVAGTALLLYAANQAFLVPVMADSARYFGREPESIAAREAIRRAGINLLDQLHGMTESSRAYDRIIIVAHSLGSVVGYELITDYWARHSGNYRIDGDPQLENAIAQVDAAAAELGLDKSVSNIPVDRYQAAQADLWRALKTARIDDKHKKESKYDFLPRNDAQHDKSKYADQRVPTWRISDFITLGSPLTYASLLMASSRKDFAERQADRKLYTCPPACVDPDASDPEGGCARRLTYSPRPGSQKFAHSACFGPVRWSNLFFRTRRFILAGDLIGGAVSNARNIDGLGWGVSDSALDHEGTGRMFAHMEYWRSRAGPDGKSTMQPAPPKHVEELVRAMRLAEEF